MAYVGKILIMPKGIYDKTTVYEVLDMVNYKGISWVAKKNGIIGIEPSDANSEHWFRMAGDNSYVTPEMFGAKGDGVTDDTDAIQNAINAGNIIVFPSKKYKVTGKNECTNLNNLSFSYCLDVPSNKILLGCNAEIISDSCTIYSFQCENIHISGFSFTSENNEISVPIVNIDESSNIVIDNCEFHDYYGDGFVTYFSNNITVKDCLLRDFTGHGLSLGKATKQVSHVTIENITIINQHEYGTSNSSNPIIFTGVDSLISNIKCLNCAWGIKVQLNSENVILDNIIFECGELSTSNTGVKVQGDSSNYRCKNITLNNISVKKSHLASTTYPIYITYTDGVNCNNIIVEDCDGGVRLTDAQNVSITNILLSEVKACFYLTKDNDITACNVQVKNTLSSFNVFVGVFGSINVDNLSIDTNSQSTYKIATGGTETSSIKINGLRSGLFNAVPFGVTTTDVIVSDYKCGESEKVKTAILSKETSTTLEMNGLVNLNSANNTLISLPKIIPLGATTEAIQIYSVDVKNGSLTIYHNASESNRKVIIINDMLVITE